MMICLFIQHMQCSTDTLVKQIHVRIIKSKDE